MAENKQFQRESKTVIVCSNVYPPNVIGGAELIAHHHAKALQARGYQVIIFAGEGDPSGVRYSMRQDTYDGLVVFRVCLHVQDYQSGFINFAHSQVDAHFDSVIDAFPPDVVHLHNIIGLSTGLIRVAKRRGIKTVLTLHDHWGFCFKNTLLKRDREICTDYSRCAECMPVINDGAQRNIPIRMRQDYFEKQLSQVDAFISPSAYLGETYVHSGVPARKMNLIWSGIGVEHLSQIKKTESDIIRFSFIGHFGSHKGIDVLIDALLFIKNLDCLCVNLVGSGELVEEVLQRIASQGLNAVVRLWGKVDSKQIDKVYQETDVLITPSIWPENQPVTVTEAMATRTPVIASEIGGIPELVIDGHNGFLFPPGDARELARKMSVFISNPKLIPIMGEKGFQLIKDKTFEAQVNEICAVYE